MGEEERCEDVIYIEDIAPKAFRVEVEGLEQLYKNLQEYLKEFMKERNIECISVVDEHRYVSVEVELENGELWLRINFRGDEYKFKTERTSPLHAFILGEITRWLHWADVLVNEAEEKGTKLLEVFRLMFIEKVDGKYVVVIYNDNDIGGIIECLVPVPVPVEDYQDV